MNQILKKVGLIYMKNKISIYPFVSLIMSIVAFGLYVLLLSGTNVYILWIVLSVISSVLPILSKYLRNADGKIGKSVEIIALIIGGYNLYFVFFAATKINLFPVFVLIVIIFVLYAKLFNNVKSDESLEKYNSDDVYKEVNNSCLNNSNDTVKNYVVSQEKNDSVDDIITDEALDTISKIQAEATIKAMKANNISQPNNEEDSDFGLVPEKPIFTYALLSVDGEEKYLDRLYTVNGEKIKWKRRGSVSVAGVNGMIDVYDTYLSSGQLYKTIYINMYGAKSSTKVPDGFVFDNTLVNIKNCYEPQIIETSKNKHCSRCCSIIDNETDICPGCGKKIFKGIKFNKFSVTVIILLFVISLVLTLCVIQFVNTRELKKEINENQVTISRLEQQVSSKENKIKDLEKEISINRKKISFFDNYAVIVPNDNRNKYHKYGCIWLEDIKGFWIYNTEAVKDRYTECPFCH